MTPKRSGPRSSGEQGPGSAQLVLDSIIHDLEELIAQRGVRTEEMIRIAGFFESAKALWLATAEGREQMPGVVLSHRLRVLIDICPPELKEYGERLALAAQILDEVAQKKRA
jgi:hypothetical protein